MIDGGLIEKSLNKDINNEIKEKKIEKNQEDKELQDSIKKYNEEKNMFSFNFKDEKEKFNELKNSYLNDIRDKTEKEYKETIKTPEDDKKWEKVTPEECQQKRDEFQNQKNSLIKEWEGKNGKDWPRYKEDVVSDNNILTHKKGHLYDAHHIHSLELGGENKAENITPLHTENHKSKEGVHCKDGPYDKLKDFCLS